MFNKIYTAQDQPEIKKWVNQSPLNEVRDQPDVPRNELVELEHKKHALLELMEEIDQKEKTVNTAYSESQLRGYNDGSQKGYADGQKRLENEINLLAMAIEGINQHLGIIKRDLADKVMKLTLSATKQILMREVSADASYITELVKSAIYTFTSDVDLLTFRANEATNNQIKNAISQSNLEIREGVQVRFLNDSRMIYGGFILETKNSEMDYSMESRWKKVVSAFVPDEASSEIHNVK